MADYPTAIGEFDAEWLPQTRLGWPEERSLGASEPLRLQPGDRAVLRLRHAPRRMPWRRQPVHEEVCVEVEGDLLALAPGERLALVRMVYQAGTELPFFRSVKARGQVTVVDRSAGELALDVALTFEQPLVDEDKLGEVALQGRVRAALPRQVD